MSELDSPLMDIVRKLIVGPGIMPTLVEAQRIDEATQALNAYFLEQALGVLPPKPASVLPEGEESYHTYNDGRRHARDDIATALTKRFGATKKEQV